MNPFSNLPEDEFGSRLQQALALPEPPQALVRRALDLWRVDPAPGLASRLQDAIQRVVATLSFDSWAVSPLAAGVRGGRSDTRHLLFNAQGRDIDLRITPQADRFRLSGQVLGPDESGEVSLYEASGSTTAAHRTQLDALGEFSMASVQGGSYRLVLAVGTDQIELPPIEVGRP